MSATSHASHVFGSFELRPGQRQLLVDGRPVPVGARALDVLLVLIEHRDRTVSKNELLDTVWPGVFVEDNNVEVQVSGLRKLLGARTIATIPGRGYRFTAELDDASSQVGAAAGMADPPSGFLGRRAAVPPKLVGRDADLQALLALVDRGRVVTVLGAGGIGKTSLALAAAHALAGAYRDGVCVVELASLREPQLLARTVAAALCVPLVESAPPLDQVVEALAERQLLLVLDNCEQLIHEAARLVGAVTTCAPGVRLLLTSQEMLHVDGELLHALGPLSTPGMHDPVLPARFGAIRLFVDRACRVQAGFAITPSNSAAVAEICRRLDGMPLAIELAAARVRVLGVGGLCEMLGDRFRVLTCGSRTALPRHQTLAATIAWSHDLLSAQERRVLRRLAVFAGGFPLELAQRVAADESLDGWAVLDVLSALVDKSLVTADADSVPRYRLLESTRAYALERLEEAGEAEATQRRHAHAVWTRFACTDEERWSDVGTLTLDAMMQRLAPDYDNLCAAFAWAAGREDADDIATGLAAASAELLCWLGECGQGYARMKALQPRVENAPASLATAMFWSGLAALGDAGDDVLEASRRAADAYRESGRHRRLYAALHHVGRSLLAAGRVDESEQVSCEMRIIGRASDPAWLRANGINLHATTLLARGRFDAAADLLTDQRELLSHLRGESTSRFDCCSHLCATLNCLGRFEETIALVGTMREAAAVQLGISMSYAEFQLIHALTLLGRLAEANALVHDAMPRWRRDRMLAFCGGHLATLAAARQRYADAARIDGATLAHARRNGWVPSPVRRVARDHMLALMTAAAVDVDAIERWRAEGETLDEDMLVALCLDG